MLQLLTKVGILNVPDWFDAGKVSIQNSFAPFSKSICCPALPSAVAEQAHNILSLPKIVFCTFHKTMAFDFACDQPKAILYWRVWTIIFGIGTSDFIFAVQCRHPACGPILLVWMGGG